MTQESYRQMADRGSVRGPYKDRSSGRWELRWSESGARRCKTGHEKQPLLDLRRELVGGDEDTGLQLPDLPRFTGKPSWFRRAFGGLEEFSRHAVNSRDTTALDCGLKHGRFLAEMARAWVPFSSALDVEEEMAELVDYVEDINAGKAVDGAEKPRALASPASTLKGSAGSSAALRRPGDPVPG